MIPHVYVPWRESALSVEGRCHLTVAGTEINLFQTKEEETWKASRCAASRLHEGLGVVILSWHH